MAHRSGGEEPVDPDLTPLLDLVMQLLMYFIMCANFINEEVTANVQLPPSQAARPLDKGEEEILFLNINREGKVMVLGQEPMDMEATTKWLNDRAMEAVKDEKNRPRTDIVIRADEGVDYLSVYQLMDLCKQKKFSKFKLRATMIGTGA